ncbi:MAG: hypothetical protein ACTSRG_11060 [Candidatus Helarchaeota archaeon]
MGNKAVGIVGGVLGLLGAGGLFALFWWVLSPALATASSMNGLYTLFLLDMYGITNSGIDWITPIFAGLALGDIALISQAILTMPVTSVNFWGVIQIDLFICVIVLVALIAVGAILAIAGAGED